MVLISSAPVLNPESLSLFYTTDESLSHAPILVFFGSSSTSASSAASYSRLQAHVYTPAGIQSYPRLAISPSSPLYAAVNRLPREEQGDEVSRALAFSLFKYFSELSDVAKDAWIKHAFSPNRPSSALHLFGEAHAAELASRMVKMDAARNIIKDLEHALASQSISHIDVDVVLPAGTIVRPRPSEVLAEEGKDDSLGRATEDRYGKYTPLIASFGETAFIPTSTIHRAPSRPSSANRTTYLSKSQKETLRREMCEFVDTEERYVQKLVELVHSIADGFRDILKNDSLATSDPAGQAVGCLFPPSLDRILEINSLFVNSIRNMLEETENAAIEDIERSVDGYTIPNPAFHVDGIEATGTVAFAEALFQWLPRFVECYGDYIRAHSRVGDHLRKVMNDASSRYAQLVQDVGEQRLLSLLIEPVQRLPRYSLYIDNIIKQLPVKHAAVKWLLRSKDLIADICAQDSLFPQRDRIVQRLLATVKGWPNSLRPHGRLISALDVQELQAPYNPHNEPSPDEFILLLFADYIMLLRRSMASTVSARGLLGMVDQHNYKLDHETLTGSSDTNLGLELADFFPLCDVDFIERANGCSFRLNLPFIGKPRSIRRQVDSDTLSSKSFRVFQLSGIYEGKASKLIREVAKARVEGRYPEDERESFAWEARNIDNEGLSVGIFSAIIDESFIGHNTARPASIRILLDAEGANSTLLRRPDGVEVLALVTMMENGFYRLDIDALNERKTRDVVTGSEFFAVLNKRRKSKVTSKPDHADTLQLGIYCKCATRYRIRKSLFIFLNITRVC